MAGKWTSRALNAKYVDSGLLDGISLDEKVVIMLQGNNAFGDLVYAYLQLTVERLIALKKLLDTGEGFTPSDFGTVIAAGKDSPSEELKAEMAATYNLIDAPTPAAPTVNFPRPPKLWGEEEEESESGW